MTVNLWTEFKDALGPRILLPDARHLPKREQGLVPWIWFFLRPYRTILIATTWVRLFRYTAFALVTYFFALLIDALQSGWAFEHIRLLWHIIYGAGLVYFIIMIAYYLQLNERLVIDKAQRGLTIFSISHLLALHLNWHDQQGTGSTLQRIMQSRNNLNELFFIFLNTILPVMTEIVGIAITIIAMHMPLYMLLLFAGYGTTYLFVSWLMTAPIDKLHDRHNLSKEKLSLRVYDFISLIRMAKIFNLRSHIVDKAYTEENTGHYIMRRLRRFYYSRGTVVDFIVWFWLMLILLTGLKNVLAARITTGAFFAVITMAYRFWGTIEDVYQAQGNYLEYKSGFLRIRETLSVPVQNFDIAPVVEMPTDWQRVECRNLAFSYHKDQPILRDINLMISRRQHVALIGHSGAGKSTMIKLLMKQIIPAEGDITVGGISLKHINSGDWLRHVALVPQDVELMNASLRDNILLDQQNIDEEFYRDCLRKAYLEEFVAGLPEGDKTEIGERGVKLSGGQRQRLGIARALVRNAEIIILDEATSSLDSESEHYIQRAMENAFADKTVIVIAHRLSTIRHADIIHVFDQGRITESGNFAALEKSNGIFARLWAMQSNGFIAD